MRKVAPKLPEAFAQLGVPLPYLEAVRDMGFTEPSDIQREMIPRGLQGADMLGQARTGTGKTCAFGLSVMPQVQADGGLQALCLVPTRELAVQVAAELTRLAKYAHLKIVAIYGGQKIATQKHNLGRKHHVVVGTPGRVMDFMQRRDLDFSGVRFVVLDEVDRMLDIGFRDDIRRILSTVPTDRQTIFVSATIESEIKRLAERFMRDPVEVNVSRDEITVDEVEQSYCPAAPEEKYRLLRAILREEDPPVTVIFCNTKHAARKLAKKLHADGFNAREIHGDLEQRKRDQVMDWLRKEKLRILVATDLASRGIDVSSITHIINYDIPKDPEVYVHRIGRTARMGAKGVAITFVTREEGKELTQIEKLINKEVPRREVRGFVPTPAVQPPTPVASPPPALQPAAVAQNAETPQPPPPEAVPHDPSRPRLVPRRTLGGKFKPSRRR